jgi:hypothetical protein
LVASYPFRAHIGKINLVPYPKCVSFHFDTVETPSDFEVDTMDMGPNMSEEETMARVLIEKKTVLNLVDAFCVATKHYLRGEGGMLSTRIPTTFDS